MSHFRIWSWMDFLSSAMSTGLAMKGCAPFIISWPGQVKPGVYDSPAIQLDLHATALAAAGLEPKPEWKLEGVDLRPFLSGQKKGSPHDALYWRFGEQMAIRAGDFKLVRYDKHADNLTGKNNQGFTAAKLYNLTSDLGETKDLAALNRAKVEELKKLLAEQKKLDPR